MKDRAFKVVLICVVSVCLGLTVIHLLYDIYAYQHCSIIRFIAKEIW